MRYLSSIFGALLISAFFAVALQPLTSPSAFVPDKSSIGAGLAQGGSTFNSQTASAANTAVSAVIAAVSGERGVVYSVLARCSAGTAQLTITDGATTIFQTAATEIGTSTIRYSWSPGLTGSYNTAFTVTLGACGATNVGTLGVQADRI